MGATGVAEDEAEYEDDEGEGDADEGTEEVSGGSLLV